MYRADLRIDAIRSHASAEAMDVSQSFANRRQRPSHANVRSTILSGHYRSHSKGGRAVRPDAYDQQARNRERPEMDALCAPLTKKCSGILTATLKLERAVRNIYAVFERKMA